MSRRASFAAFLLAPALLWACGTADGESASTAVLTVPNVGNLPGPFAVHATTTTPTTDAPAATVEAAPPTTEEPVDTTEPEDAEELDPATIGGLAEGPRLLFLGDSITESIGERYSGGVCRELVPQGWQVAMDAETGRFIGDGFDVLERRLAEDDWDAAVLNFGSNYRGDPADYGLTLRRMLNRLLPRPVLLVTVSEPVENRAEVNYVLREAARRYETVGVLVWPDARGVAGSLTAGDGLHLSGAGQERLATLVRDAVGEAPGDATGACLDLDDGETPDGSTPESSEPSSSQGSDSGESTDLGPTTTDGDAVTSDTATDASTG